MNKQITLHVVKDKKCYRLIYSTLSFVMHRKSYSPSKTVRFFLAHPVYSVECSRRDMDVDSDRRLEAFIMWIRIRMEKIGGLIKLLMRKFSEKLVKTGKY